MDRTDLSKNIVRGFLAYERMLETNTDLHRRVQFWAFLQPSRQDIGDYRSYLGSVLSVAARINRRFSSGGWTPIRVEVEENMHKAIAAYKCFDVLLVNPIYDGMNLVAKEGPLCNTRHGVLVLSENAGAHEEIGDFALTVNPFDASSRSLPPWDPTASVTKPPFRLGARRGRDRCQDGLVSSGPPSRSLAVRGPFRGVSGHDHHTREFVRQVVSQGVRVHLTDLAEWHPVKLPPDACDLIGAEMLRSWMGESETVRPRAIRRPTRCPTPAPARAAAAASGTGGSGPAHREGEVAAASRRVSAGRFHFSSTSFSTEVWSKTSDRTKFRPRVR